MKTHENAQNRVQANRKSAKVVTGWLDSAALADNITGSTVSEVPPRGREVPVQDEFDATAPPLFPDPTVLDEVLFDYLRRADRMGWSPYDLVDAEQMRKLARPERLNEHQREALKTVLYVEDHLPGYLSEYLRVMMDPDQPDDPYIFHPHALHY